MWPAPMLVSEIVTVGRSSAKGLHLAMSAHMSLTLRSQHIPANLPQNYHTPSGALLKCRKNTIERWFALGPCGDDELVHGPCRAIRPIRRIKIQRIDVRAYYDPCSCVPTTGTSANPEASNAIKKGKRGVKYLRTNMDKTVWHDRGCDCQHQKTHWHVTSLMPNETLRVFIQAKGSQAACCMKTRRNVARLIARRDKREIMALHACAFVSPLRAHLQANRAQRKDQSSFH